MIILSLTSDWMALFLGSVVIQFMGKISFSLYLWHQPVFVFSKIYNIIEKLKFISYNISYKLS